VVDLFSQSSVTGRALKVIVESLLNPILGQVERVGPVAKRFFQGLVIGALLVTIVILTVRRWWKRTFGDSELLQGLDVATAALYAGAVAAGTLAVAIGLVALAAVALVAVIAAPFVVGWFMITKFLAVVDRVREAFGGLGGEATTAGRGISTGLAIGIASGKGGVIGAITNLGGEAWAAFKSKLGIASPSKLFRFGGRATALGVVGGLRDEQTNVDRAVRRLVMAPQIAANDVKPRALAAVRATTISVKSDAESAQPTDRGQSGGARPGPGGPLIGQFIYQGKANESDARAMAEDAAAILQRQLEGAGIHMGARRAA
jgi:hypothetical protein